MSEQSHREELLNQFRQTGEVLENFMASRTLAEQRAISQPAGWSASDLLTAIAFWMNYTVERIGYYQRGEAAPREVDFGAVQERALHAAADRPWNERAEEVRRALADLLATVDRCLDALLETDNAYGEGPGGPLWGEVQANGFIWPLQELEKYLRQVGDVARTDQIRALLAPVAGEPEIITCDLVAPEQVRAWQQEAARDPLVIDVRGAADFARGHVPGAHHIPLSRLAQQLKRLPRDRPIVTYCNMHHPGQSRGEHAASLLSAEGFEAMALAGGFPAWEAAGLAVETGPQAK